MVSKRFEVVWLLLLVSRSSVIQFVVGVGVFVIGSYVVGLVRFFVRGLVRFFVGLIRVRQIIFQIGPRIVSRGILSLQEIIVGSALVV